MSTPFGVCIARVLSPPLDPSESLTKGLTKKERDAFEAEKHRGYLIDRSRVRGDLALAYMRWCDITRTPFIAVSTGGVKLWLSSGSATLSSQGMENITALFRKYRWLGAHKEEYNWVCGNTCQATAVLPRDRERLAREMFFSVRRLENLDTSMRNIDRSMFPPGKNWVFFGNSTVIRPPERWKRKPLKMKLPRTELTTRQLVQHMRDATHREEW